MALRFKSIRLKNWRNFKDVKVEMGQRAFLVGPNAAGKSNFLDAVRFLGDLVRVGGGLQYAVGEREGVDKIRSLYATSNNRIQIEVCLVCASEGRKKGAEWSYFLEFTKDKQTKQPLITKERVSRDNQPPLLDRPKKEDEEDKQRLTQTHLEQVNANREFRAVADFFNSVRYLHLVPQLVRETDRYVRSETDPYGGDFLEQVARMSEKERKLRLKLINNVLKKAVPHFKKLAFERDTVKGRPHIKALYEHWRPQGNWQNEKQFSDGTLRMIGLMWAVLNGDGPLLLEEPELSLHSEVIRRIPQLLYILTRETQRQIIVSTHSSELLADKGIGAEEVFLFSPTDKKGTQVEPASNDKQIKSLLERGALIGDVVMPRTAPKNVNQLSLPFADS
ncbi:MAG: chromosome segregation protein SMC [Myxococcales bacterium]|nr:MAG: chromosome segregation protein SMC [Myxococcales bacterium]